MIGGFIGAPIGGVFNRGITATATQSLSIAQAASAQVLVSAAAAQALSVGQDAQSQVFVKGSAGQSLGIGQTVGLHNAWHDGYPFPTEAERKRIKAKTKAERRELRKKRLEEEQREAAIRAAYEALTPKPPEPPRPIIVKRERIVPPPSFAVPPIDIAALMHERKRKAIALALLLAA
jgi:hypothetical protein